MSVTGGGSTQNVGTLQATYKIDATAGMNTIGQLNVAANNLKAAFGNVTFRIDAGNSPQIVQQLTQAAINAKQAYADAQTALAGYRNQLTLTQQATTNLRNAQIQAQQTIQQTRVIQQQQAQTTQQNVAALQQLNLATAAVRQQQQQTTLATAQLNNQMAQMRLAALQAAQAQQQNNSSAAQWITALRQTAIAVLALKVAHEALEVSIHLVRQAFEDSVGSAIKWQTTLNQLANNTTLTDQSLKEIDKTIRGLAAQSNASMDQMAIAFRHATDVGFNLADSQKIVKEAMMSSQTAGTALGETGRVLSIVMHQFGIDADQAGGAMNVLHLAAAEGNTTLEQFVSGGGRALATAASLGVNLQETSAAMSAMTREGYNMFQSATMVQDILIHIVAPSIEAKQAINELSKATGVDLAADFTTAGLQAKGLSGIMQDVQKVIEITGDQAIAFKLIPALRGGRGELVLTTQGASDFRNILNDLNDTMAGKTNPTLDAWNRTIETTGFKIGQLLNIVHLFALEIGDILLPVISRATEILIEFGNALGQQFNVAGITERIALATPTDVPAPRTTAAAQAMKDFNLAAAQTNSANVAKASNDLAAAKQNADAATAAVRGLNEQLAPKQADMDRLKEQIAQITTYYKSQIDPITAQIRNAERMSTSEFDRHIAELKLQGQQIQLQLTKPDTSGFDQTIDDLRAKLDGLGEASTDAIDARIDDLQKQIRALGTIATVELDKNITNLRNQLAAIGDTTELDRKIEDLQKQLQAPDQSTRGQETGMAVLQEQFAAGQITADTFQQGYGALAQQKQAISEANYTRKSGLEQQIALLTTERDAQKRADEDHKNALQDQIKQLELQKQTVEETNRSKKDQLQSSLDAARDEREQIVKTHDEQRKSIELEIRANERAKNEATREYEAKMKVLDAEMQRYKLLDQQDQIARELITYPLKQRVDDLKEAQTQQLDPLYAQRDALQEQLNLLNEQKREWENTAASARAAASAAESYGKSLGAAGGGGYQYEPPGLPGGGAATGYKGRYGEQPELILGPGGNMFDVTGPAGRQPNALTEAVDKLLIKLEEVRVWLMAHKDEIANAIGDAFNGAINFMEDAYNVIGGMGKLLYDLSQQNWSNIPGDLEMIGRGMRGGPNAAGGGGGSTAPELTLGPGGNAGAAVGGTGRTLPGTGMTLTPEVDQWLKAFTSWLTDPSQWAQAFFKNTGIGNIPANYGGPQMPGGATGGSSGDFKVIDPATGKPKGIIAADIGPDESQINKWIGDLSKFGGSWDELKQKIADAEAAQKAYTNTTTTDVGAGSQAQQAMESYGKMVATSVGDGSASDLALQEHGTDAKAIWGPGGLYDQYLAQGGTVPRLFQNYASTMKNTFDKGGPAQTPMTNYSTFLNEMFGKGGDTDKLMTIQVPEIMRGFVSQMGGTFDKDTGTATVPVKSFATFMKNFFANDGASQLANLLGVDVPTIMTALDTMMGTHFNDTGTARDPITSYASFFDEMFKKDGTLSKMTAGLGLAIDAVMPANVVPLNSFLTSVSTAIKDIGTQLDVAELGFKFDPIVYTTAGGNNATRGYGAGPGAGDGPPTSGSSITVPASAAAAVDSLDTLKLPGVLSSLGERVTELTKEGLRKFLEDKIQQYGPQLDASHGGSYTGAYPSIPDGQWAAVARVAASHLGETTQPSGLPWAWWCEKFVADMDDAAGYRSGRYDTALTHANSTPLYSGEPPAGAGVYFDSSWSYAGHAAIATGSGNQAITTPIGGTGLAISTANIIGVSGYMGWKPPGAAMGMVATTPQIVTVGDVPGGVPEFVAPQPMLRQTFLDAMAEGFGGKMIAYFEKGAIDVDGEGNATGDPSKMSLRMAALTRGITPH